MYKIKYEIDGGLVVQVGNVDAEPKARMASLDDPNSSEFATAQVDSLPANRDGHTMILHYLNNTLVATYTTIEGWIELATTANTVSTLAQSLTLEQQAQVNTNIGTQAIADMAAKQLFIDMWNTRCGRLGRYNAESGYFELSEVTDITYERAKMIMLYSNGYGSNAALQAGISTRLYVENMIDYPVDINLPAYSNWNGSKNYSLYLYGSNVKILLLEAVNTFPGADSSNCYLSSSFTGYTMYSSRTTRIIGIINMNNVTATTIMERYGEKLEQISINQLHQNYNISSWVKINNPSLGFMITNAKASPDFAITVASNVYERAMVDPAIIAALAAKPNITLASA